jgi:hypothetical protein
MFAPISVEAMDIVIEGLVRNGMGLFDKPHGKEPTRKPKKAKLKRTAIRLLAFCVSICLVVGLTGCAGFRNYPEPYKQYRSYEYGVFSFLGQNHDMAESAELAEQALALALNEKGGLWERWDAIVLLCAQKVFAQNGFSWWKERGKRGMWEPVVSETDFSDLSHIAARVLNQIDFSDKKLWKKEQERFMDWGISVPLALVLTAAFPELSADKVVEIAAGVSGHNDYTSVAATAAIPFDNLLAAHLEVLKQTAPRLFEIRYFDSCYSDPRVVFSKASAYLSSTDERFALLTYYKTEILPLTEEYPDSIDTRTRYESYGFSGFGGGYRGHSGHEGRLEPLKIALDEDELKGFVPDATNPWRKLKEDLLFRLKMRGVTFEEFKGFYAEDPDKTLGYFGLTPDEFREIVAKTVFSGKLLIATHEEWPEEIGPSPLTVPPLYINGDAMLNLPSDLAAENEDEIDYLVLQTRNYEHTLSYQLKKATEVSESDLKGISSYTTIYVFDWRTKECIYCSEPMVRSPESNLPYDGGLVYVMPNLEPTSEDVMEELGRFFDFSVSYPEEK